MRKLFFFVTYGKAYRWHEDRRCGIPGHLGAVL